MVYFNKSKNLPIIGVTGRLTFTDHELIFTYKYWLKLKIRISKDSYYLLGFGDKIKQKRINVYREKIDSCIKNIIVMDINSNYLYNLLLKGN